jgi:hypothetical protein
VRARLHPQTEDFNRVPNDVAICRLSGCGSEDAKQANDGCRCR